jgi:hypothetical protein
MIKQNVLKLLDTRRAAPGESVEYGWFTFRVAEGDGRLDLETLDFQEMASFTRNFGIVEQIMDEQTRILEQAGAEPLLCNLRQFATVSQAYQPGYPAALMHRADNPRNANSGWYLGVADADTFAKKHDSVSLYELTIADRRLLPFWLLPLGYSVAFDGESPRVMDSDVSEEFMRDRGIEERRPWWKFW